MAVNVLEQTTSRRVAAVVFLRNSGGKQFTTTFTPQTYQVRVVSTLPIWATIGSTQVVTANSSATYLPANVPEYFAVTSGQVLNFISTSTSTGYVVVTESV